MYLPLLASSGVLCIFKLRKWRQSLSFEEIHHLDALSCNEFFIIWRYQIPTSIYMIMKIATALSSKTVGYITGCHANM